VAKNAATPTGIHHGDTEDTEKKEEEKEPRIKHGLNTDGKEHGFYYLCFICV
jgi:hypothetical protein